MAARRCRTPKGRFKKCGGKNARKTKCVMTKAGRCKKRRRKSR